jgi:hypothetical protein
MIKCSMPTCEPTTRIFSDKNRTLDGLLEYLGDDVFEEVQFVWESFDSINEGVDTLHGIQKREEFLIPVQLVLDGLCSASDVKRRI